MPSHFLFVDETGDLGPKGTEIYGYGMIEVAAKNYSKIREIVAEERWRFRIYRDFELSKDTRPLVNVMKQFKELSGAGILSVSGLYINKTRYKGRYLSWSDIDLPASAERAHYLRNYLLRQALEYHYSPGPIDSRRIDLVIDRIAVNSAQRANLEDYLMGKMPLKEEFKIPSIDHVTIADSSYIEGLQMAHNVADVVKRMAVGNFDNEVAMETDVIRITEFLGTEQSSEKDKGTAPPTG